MFNFVFILNEEKEFDGEISLLDVLTHNGPVRILESHQPFLSRIEKTLSFEIDKKNKKEYKISNGFLYTNGKTCFLIAEILN